MKYFQVLCVKSLVNISEYLAPPALVGVTGHPTSVWISYRRSMALCGAW